MTWFQLHQGDSRNVLKTLAESSVDSIICDPPYGLEFMGKDWDAPWKETSGGFSAPGIGARATEWPSYKGGNRSRCATCSMLVGQGGSPCKCENPRPVLQDAARMQLFQAWCEEWAVECLRVLKPGGHLLAFGGSRTYHRLACAVEDAGFEVRDQLQWIYGSGFPKSHNGEWGGTALKPAHEPICMARKPLIGTVEANWLAYGTGALDIHGCRVGSDDGRWPANIIHDGSDEVIAAFPDAPGQQADISTTAPSEKTSLVYGRMNREGEASSDSDSDNEGAVGFKMKPGARRLDEGSAARFFYCAKASQEDRNEGLAARSPHPTVKPTDLMRYLCRLVTPKDGIVLDPFMGSGSTGKAAMLEGFAFVGIDMTPEYVEIARARIEFAKKQGYQPDLLEAA